MNWHRTSTVTPAARRSAIGGGWKQFLLSMANPTMLLGITLVVLGLILVSRLESFAENVLGDVRIGLLQEIDVDIKGTLGAIGTTEKELKHIAKRLGAIAEHAEITVSPSVLESLRSIRDELQNLQKTAGALPVEAANALTQRIDAAIVGSSETLRPLTQPEFRVLRRDVRTMQRTLAELTSSRAAVSDHAIRSIAAAAAKAIIEIRQCGVEPAK